MTRMRLNVYLARCGLGSRRSVESLVAERRIRVNGRVIQHPATPIETERDLVEVDGQKIEPHRERYLLLHKPRGFACTKFDPYFSKTIYQLLPAELQHLNYVGRLDVESEGMLLLSSDGKWIQQISHPRNEILKTYHVQIKGHPTHEDLDRVRRGIQSDGELLKPRSVKLRNPASIPTRKAELEIVLNEGKKREIRRIFSHLGYSVLRLVRVRTGQLELDRLPPGHWRELTPLEVKEAVRKTAHHPEHRLRSHNRRPIKKD